MDADFSRRNLLRGGFFASVAAALRPRSAQAALPENTTLMEVHTTINGSAQTLSVDPEGVALDIFRDQLGLKGCKKGCGQGACGACTVLIDGRPQVSCLLPSTALEGRKVTTIEGIGNTDLHPVQRAFMACDALQCGYCTPGFIVSATAFFEQWRTNHGKTKPEAPDVADALEGNLCRCGAHASIIRAVQQACEGLYDQADPPPARVDAREKVTGKATYTVDVVLPDMLETAVLRSSEAHAILMGLDTQAAEAMPGVHAVIRLCDIGKTIRFAGQEIAAVAATDAATAKAALAAITVNYAPKANVIGLTAAMAPGAAIVYESAKLVKEEAPQAGEVITAPAPLSENLRGPLSLSMLGKPLAAKDNIDDLKAEGGLVIEQEFQNAVQCHTPLEPHSAVARWNTDGSLELWTSTQCCRDMADDLRERYSIEDVRVYAPYVGGAFGSKAGFSMEHRIAIELAQKAKKPVRYVLSRSEDLHVGGLRPGQVSVLKLAVDAEGHYAGLDAVNYADAGVAAGAASGFTLRLLYKSPYKAINEYDVLSHTPPTRAFRGPGGPQSMFAIEQITDMVALARKEDPLTLRRRWDPNRARNRLYDWLESLPLWKNRAPSLAADTGRFRRGVGLAVGAWAPFVDTATEVSLQSGPSGLIAACGTQDMGQGSRSVVAYEVASVFGLEITDIQIRFGDSRDPYGPMSAGSRSTASLAPAARNAAEQLKALLVEDAEGRLIDPVAEATGIRHSAGLLPWKDAIRQSSPRTVIGRRGKDTDGYWLPVSIGGLRILKELPGVVQLTAVEVDSLTGRIRVTESWSGVGVGRIVAPPVARSQIQGGVVQGIGYALYEERHLDPHTGRLLSASLDNYHLTGIGDIPELNVHFDEEGFKGVAGGSVGLAELSTIPVAASIANAVHHATGWRPLSTPIRMQHWLGRNK